MSNISSQNKNISVILSFTGTADSGFSVDIRISENAIPIYQLNGQKIPDAPELESLYHEWQKYHLIQGRSISRLKRAMDIPDAVIGYSSVDKCLSSADNLVSYLERNWFGSDKFLLLKEWIRSRVVLKEDNSVPVFFEFRTGSRDQDILLRRLPWSSWNLFRELPNTEPVLGITIGKPVDPLLKDIKVLLVLGSDEGGLDLSADEYFVSELSKIGARIQRLSCPEPEELYSEIKKNSYDILFFAGHSLSEADQRDGTVLLKPDTPVPIDPLIDSLRISSKSGLKLAIFNSCDGLGLADTLLSNAKIPSVLVFREPVPDEVARKFLQCFLEEFSSGKPLFLSVREARNRLRFLEFRAENPLPSASWLPIVCQNSSQPEIFLQLPEAAKPIPADVQKSTSVTALSPSLSQRWIARSGAVALVVASLAFAGFGLRQSRSPTPTPTPSVSVASDNFMSTGNRLLLTSETNTAKVRGIEAYANEDWEGAITAFRESLNLEEGDPEAWIYLNNAIAEKNSALDSDSTIVNLALAISIPEDEDDPDGEDEQGLAKELMRGVALRQAEFNCGVDSLVDSVDSTSDSLNCQGTQDSFVHFTIADDQVPDVEPSTRAQEIARTLVEENEIVAIVGHFSSGLCQEAGEIYGENRIVMISPTCTATGLTLGENTLNSYFFRTVPNDAVAAQTLFEEVSAAGQQVAVIYDDNTYSKSFKKSFGEGLIDQDYIYECSLISSDSPAFDPEQCAVEVAQSNADFLLLIPPSKVRTYALPVLNYLDGDIIPLGSDSVYNSEVIEKYGEEASELGLQIYISWLPDPNDVTPFEENAKQLFSTDGLNWRTQSSYDATSAIVHGIQRLLESGDEITGASLQGRLSDSRFAADGVVGENSVKFDRNGDRDLRDLDGQIGMIVQVEETPNSTPENPRYRFVRSVD